MITMKKQSQQQQEFKTMLQNLRRYREYADDTARKMLGATAGQMHSLNYLWMKYQMYFIQQLHETINRHIIRAETVGEFSKAQGWKIS